MPTPDDPCMVNLFLLLFCSLMGWFFSLGVRRYLSGTSEAPRRDAWLLFVWGYAWVLVLLVNAADASSVRRSWEAQAARPPLQSLAAVEAAGNGSEVVLVGRARPEQKPSADASPAYLIEYDLDGKRWGESGVMRLDLAGGAQKLTGLDTAPYWNWNYERGNRVRYWLAPGDPVVVLGTVRHSVGIFGSEKGRRQISVEAGLVRRGSHADFVAAAGEQGRRLWPRLLAWLSLAAAIVIALLPLVHWLRRLVGRGLARRATVE
jgi:hypothetical protein